MLLGAFLAPPALAEDKLNGLLLVAEASLKDPNFEKTVVLVVRHGHAGAFGLVLNRFGETMPVTEVLALFGESAPASDLDIDLHYGGPVARSASLVLHGADFETDRTDSAGRSLRVSPVVDTLRALLDDAGPARARVFFGYAGWAPGQLEAEIAGGAWAIVEADPAIVFEVSPGEMWERARRRVSVDL